MIDFDEIKIGDTFRLTKMVFRIRADQPPILAGTVFQVERLQGTKAEAILRNREKRGIDLLSVGGLYELKVSFDWFNEVFVPYP